jgi:hypothetical protein
VRVGNWIIKSSNVDEAVRIKVVRPMILEMEGRCGREVEGRRGCVEGSLQDAGCRNPVMTDRDAASSCVCDRIV